MGRPCTICTHDERTAIEAELEAGQPLREVAAGYGTSKTALHRHRHLHLVEPALRAMETPHGRSGTRVPAVVRWGLVAAGILAVVWVRNTLGDARGSGQG